MPEAQAEAPARMRPVQATKLRESIYDALRDAFTAGTFAPGETLSLRDLAAELGTSPTPVREAVRRLVAEGALVDTPSRTLMVPPFDARRMADLKAARLALEPLVLAQAAERMTAADVGALGTLLGGLARAEGQGPDLRGNYAFHFAIYRHAGSEVLTPLIEALWVQYGAFLNRVVREAEAIAMDEHAHHHEIVAALGAGDVAAAQRALAADIERSFAVVGARA